MDVEAEYESTNCRGDEVLGRLVEVTMNWTDLVGDPANEGEMRRKEVVCYLLPPLTRKFMRWKIFCVVHPSSGTRRWILMS